MLAPLLPLCVAAGLEALARPLAQAAERCADAIADDVNAKMIGGPEVWAARLQPFFPRVYDFLVRRVKST